MVSLFRGLSGAILDQALSFLHQGEPAATMRGRTGPQAPEGSGRHLNYPDGRPQEHPPGSFQSAPTLPGFFPGTLDLGRRGVTGVRLSNGNGHGTPLPDRQYGTPPAPRGTSVPGAPHQQGRPHPLATEPRKAVQHTRLDAGTSSGTFSMNSGRLSFHPASTGHPKVTAQHVKADLTQLPTWTLSVYSFYKEEPNAIAGVDISPEEARLRYLQDRNSYVEQLEKLRRGVADRVEVTLANASKLVELPPKSRAEAIEALAKDFISGTDSRNERQIEKEKALMAAGFNFPERGRGDKTKASKTVTFAKGTFGDPGTAANGTKPEQQASSTDVNSLSDVNTRSTMGLTDPSEAPADDPGYQAILRLITNASAAIHPLISRYALSHKPPHPFISYDGVQLYTQVYKQEQQRRPDEEESALYASPRFELGKVPRTPPTSDMIGY